MFKTATMFLTNVTVIDGAFIDSEGRVKGMTFNPQFLVTGPVDPTEQVVADFSSAKKEIKALIDDHFKGFDHKLWVIEGASNAKLSSRDELGAPILVETPFITARGDANYVRYVPLGFGKKLDAPIPYRHVSPENIFEYMAQAISDYLTFWLDKEYPGIGVQIEPLTNNVSYPGGQDRTHLCFFRYVHGLRNSTSYGCQQPLHGHLSYLYAASMNEDTGRIVPVWSPTIMKLVEELNDRVIFDERTIIDLEESSGRTTITQEYESCTRGTFKVTFRDLDRYFLMDRDPTIENIVEFVRDTYPHLMDQLRKTRTTHLFISEGLTKGALIEL